jgi:protocatechuate 3,4-dioxygenase beta subunit
MNGLAGVVLAMSVLSAVWAQVPPPPAPTSPQGARDAQKLRTGTARLSGRVLSADTGKPLRRAVVRAQSPELREGRSVSTEADGSWEIKELPAGRYSITVQKGGFVPVAFGQRRPFEQGKPVDLADGQTVEKLEISLPRGSVVSGRIVDEFGEPVSGARVSAMRHRFMNGQRRLLPVSSAGASDTTDDLGQYRLHGLSPGEYYVSASMSATLTLEVSTDRTGYAPTYYPGTIAVTEAQRVPLALGQEAAEISFPLAPTRIAKLSGTATSSNGKPVANGMIMLTTTGGAVGAAGSPLIGAAMTQADGSFTISNVPPGDYRFEMMTAADAEVIAQTGTTSGIAMSESLSTPITVTGTDVTGIVLISAPTATATGRIVFDGEPPAEAAAGVTVFGLPDTPTSLPLGGFTRARTDWTFAIKGLTGSRSFRVNPPTGWYLESVTLNDVDVTDTAVECKPGETISGIEFHLTRSAATLSGEVLDEKGRPAAEYVVVLFSSDSRKWGHQTRFVRSARPDQSGKFIFKGLPPDEYLAVALDYLEPGEEADPELLQRLAPMGTRVAIQRGASTAISLKRSR